jgi:hypothetical protein
MEFLNHEQGTKDIKPCTFQLTFIFQNFSMLLCQKASQVHIYKKYIDLLFLLKINKDFSQ